MPQARPQMQQYVSIRNKEVRPTSHGNSPISKSGRFKHDLRRHPRARRQQAAPAATRLDEIVVSTDDNAIVQEAARLRCAWILRPEYLAQDETPTLPVLLHAVQFYPASTVIVTLQPTVPFRLGIEIDEAIEALDRFEAD